MDAYLADYQEREGVRAKERLEQLKATHKEIVDNLRVRRQELQKLYDRYGLEDPKNADSRYQSALQQLTAAQTQQRQLLLLVTAAETDLAKERDKALHPPEIEISDLDIDNELKDDPTFKRQKEELSRAVIEVQQILATVAPAAQA